MSLLRRVRSFTLNKKSKSADDNDSNKNKTNENRNIHNINQGSKTKNDGTKIPKKKKLEREKSISFDCVSSATFQNDLENNQLFVKQKLKSDESDKSSSKSFEDNIDKISNLVEVRKWKIDKANKRFNSMDDIGIGQIGTKSRFGRQTGSRENIEKSAQFTSELNLTLQKKIKTIRAYNELIKNIEDHVQDDFTDNNNKPTHFPLPADEDVEIRKHHLNIRPGRSKTYNFDSDKFASDSNENFELRNVSKIQIGDDLCAKLRKNEKLALINENLSILSENGNIRTLKNGVTMQMGAKLINKKDVEIMDINKTVYVLHFETSRDARYFVDSDYQESNEKITIKTKLLRLLGKRSSRDFLESKGILRNEPIFGNTLSDIYESSRGLPKFLTKIIELIEIPQNIKNLGLYRTSGNLATIQKIRFEVDNGKLDILDEYKNDVDVLTGSLKLFFRELKKPLIPFDICHDLLQIFSQNDNPDRIAAIIKKLPEANVAVLDYLMRHLVRVCNFKIENKMDVYNMSVCWGPSLIAIPENCSDVVAQTGNVSRVVEFLIRHYKNCPKTDTPKTALVQNQNVENQLKNCNDVQDVLKKIIELIETHIKSDGLYKKSGSTTKIDKIVKKMEKSKLNELEKYKNDTNDLACALKKYLSALPEPLVPKHIVNQLKSPICDKQNLLTQIEHIPNIDALVLLLRHFGNVLRENKSSMSGLTSIWAAILFDGVHQNGCQFLDFLLNVYGNRLVLPDLVMKENRFRQSKYDNVPVEGENVRGEACFLDDNHKTDSR